MVHEWIDELKRPYVDLSLSKI